MPYSDARSTNWTWHLVPFASEHKVAANMLKKLLIQGRPLAEHRELPTSGFIEQADGTSWMAMFCLDMLTIALELALHNAVYEELACKYKSRAVLDPAEVLENGFDSVAMKIVRSY